jgi:hypothetical protein
MFHEPIVPRQHLGALRVYPTTPSAEFPRPGDSALTRSSTLKIPGSLKQPGFPIPARRGRKKLATD